MVSENKKIPNTWDLKRIGDLGEIVTGSTPKTNVDEYWGGDIPFVSPTDMKGTRYIKDTERTVTYKGAQTGRIIPKNSVMVTCIASIGKLAISSQECITNQQINTIIPHKDYNHEFLYYAISNQVPYLQTLAGTTAVPIINKKTFSDVLLPVPPIKEQHKIAAILSSVDEAIEKTEAIIEQTEKVKKGLMQQLLTKGIGHTKFKKTEIGEIPEEWEVKRLDEIAKVSGGKRLPKGKSLTSVKNDHPYIRVADMQEDGISLENIQYVPTDVAKSIRRYTVNAGDIYISVAGTLGLVGIVPPELDGANLTENADRISNIKCNNIFLKYVLQSDLIQSIIEREKTISAQPKLALTRIKGFLIPIPSVEEQKKIADILLAVEKKLKSEKQKHVQLLLIKKGLMQVLLTGKVRVKVDDEVVSL